MPAKIIDLRHYVADRYFFPQIRKVRHAKIIGTSLFIELLTTKPITKDMLPIWLTWLSSLRWQVTHMQSGRRARCGGRSRPIIALRELDEEGLTIEIRPIFPGLSEIRASEHFRIDVWGACTHKHFVNSPYSANDSDGQSAIAPSTSRPRQRLSHKRLPQLRDHDVPYLRRVH
jgi:hypothetical protein